MKTKRPSGIESKYQWIERAATFEVKDFALHLKAPRLRFFMAAVTGDQGGKFDEMNNEVAGILTFVRLNPLTFNELVNGLQGV